MLRQNDEDSSSTSIAEIVVDNIQDVSTTKAFVSCETDIMSG